MLVPSLVGMCAASFLIGASAKSCFSCVANETERTCAAVDSRWKKRAPLSAESVEQQALRPLMKKVRIVLPPNDRKSSSMWQNGGVATGGHKSLKRNNDHYNRQKKKKKFPMLSGSFWSQLYRTLTEIPDETDPMSKRLSGKQLQQLYMCSFLLGREK